MRTGYQNSRREQTVTTVSIMRVKKGGMTAIKVSNTTKGVGLFIFSWALEAKFLNKRQSQTQKFLARDKGIIWFI